MMIPSDRQALEKATARIADLVDAPAQQRSTSDESSSADGRSSRVDTVIKAGPFTFLVEWKRSSRVSTVTAAIERLKAWQLNGHGEAIPLLTVPYMGDAGRTCCERAGVAWLDLSGNASIQAPGLRIQIQGHSNRYLQRGRPSSVFAPKSARIARWLMTHRNVPTSQRQLAKDTGLGEGHVSKVVRRMEAQRLLTRTPDRQVQLRDEGVLLDAWAEEYDFFRHGLLPGHIPARTGGARLTTLAESLSEQGVSYAVTGLAAAWLIEPFADFRLVSVYLREPPTDSLQARIGFRPTDRGANVWLVVPKDEGVFHGAQPRDGVWTVHPVQAYLDVQSHPERAKEAAQRLREFILGSG